MNAIVRPAVREPAPFVTRGEAAQAHWRWLDGAELIPLARAGVRFVNGVRVERQEERKKGAA